MTNNGKTRTVSAINAGAETPGADVYSVFIT
jgi:hypothetical protein